MTGYTYEQAGVSIAAGNALVRAIGPLARSTRRPGADAELGGFGGFFDLKAAGFEDPLLVAANAYFVATEFALVAVRRSQVQIWVSEGRRGAAAITTSRQR